MKKILIVFCLCITGSIKVAAQNTADSLYPDSKNLPKEKLNDLFLLGKTWGFLKYFHPAVASGKFDWDKELMNFLPAYTAVHSRKERNDSLLSWINRLGDVPSKRAGNYDSIKDARLKPDFSWISSSNFSPELTEKLRYILQNRAQGDQYYIKFHSIEGLNIPEFLHENSYSKEPYPSAKLRLVALFRFWNIIEYWYPYKYDLPWNSILKEQIGLMLQAADGKDYNKSIQRLNASLKDGHGFIRSRISQEMLGYYYMPLIFRFVENKLIVSSVTDDAAAGGIKQGAVVISINTVPVKAIEKERLPYIPAATLAAARLDLARELNRTEDSTTVIRFQQDGITKEVAVKNFYTKKAISPYTPDFTAQKDSALFVLPGNILYLNLGNLKGKDSTLIRTGISHSDALILDLRQNMAENGEAVNPFGIISAALKQGPSFNIFTTQQPGFAGVFKFVDAGISPADSVVYHYKKNVVVLINEAVISVGESMAMDFSTAYHAVLMGTATSGTNGMNSFVMLPGNIATGFSGTGNYWPNRKNIQRKGIVPDIKVVPTIKGYKAGRDEILEKAIDYLAAKNK
ncbi:MAG: S41 family peptidase [Ferruginibacter sp.]